MSRATFLTRVVLENYKSIAACDVALGPLTFLVGPNGSGKSNFLDALRFVAEALRHSVGEALRSRGGGTAVCYAPHQPQASFRIRLEFADSAGQTGHYALRVGALPDSGTPARWGVIDEALGLPTAAGDVGTGLRSLHQQRERSVLADRLALAVLADEPAYQPVYEALTRMLFYNVQPRRVEDVATFDPGQFLPSDGSSLASVLFRLGVSDGEVLERINEYLRLVLPGLIRARAEPVLGNGKALAPGSPKIALLFEQKLPGQGVHLFWPSQMSDGTLRALGILTALLQAAAKEGPRPSLVAVEEPESQVHAAVMAVLRDAMYEASYSTQVMVTTHSADLLDDKGVDPASILVVDASGGATRIGPPSEVDRSVIRDRLYTPGELLRIGQLSPGGVAHAESRVAGSTGRESGLAS